MYTQATNPLRSHGPDHHQRVYENAMKLVDTVGLPYDADVLAGAALLHDVAAYYPDETGDAYHEHDHVIAEEALRRVEFPEEKIAATLDAIQYHGSDPKYKKDNESIETTILRDADKIDAFGPVGVARIVMVRTLNGDTLEDIVADFWTGGHLEQKWQSISTDAARTMTQDNYEYSKNFFQNLAEALQPRVDA
jgi:HD superfamily phosphodiesterase